jgi:hypothetical protein
VTTSRKTASRIRVLSSAARPEVGPASRVSSATGAVVSQPQKMNSAAKHAVWEHAMTADADWGEPRQLRGRGVHAGMSGEHACQRHDAEEHEREELE